VYLIDAPVVVVEMLTICGVEYVPESGVITGVSTVEKALGVISIFRNEWNPMSTVTDMLSVL